MLRSVVRFCKVMMNNLHILSPIDHTHRQKSKLLSPGPSPIVLLKQSYNSSPSILVIVGDLVSEKGPSWTISCEK